MDASLSADALMASVCVLPVEVNLAIHKLYKSICSPQDISLHVWSERIHYVILSYLKLVVLTHNCFAVFMELTLDCILLKPRVSICQGLPSTLYDEVLWFTYCTSLRLLPLKG